MSTRSISESSATYLPNAEDRRQLIDIKESLSALQEETQQPDRPLTPELADVLFKVADQLSRGKAIFVAPYDTKLTTQDAADYLGISRPTLVKLLEQGDIPFTRVGRQRRVMLSDLQHYAVTQHDKNMQIFDAIAADEDPRATLDNPLIS